MKKKSAIIFDLAVLKGAMKALKVVTHQLNQKIIHLLDEKGEMNVTGIYLALKLEQSVASGRLAPLRRVGVVVAERRGKFIFYSVNKDRIAEIQKLAKELDELVKK